MLNQSKSFDVTRLFPSLSIGGSSSAGGGRRVYQIEEIPEHWTQITDPEQAKQWALAINLGTTMGVN